MYFCTPNSLVSFDVVFNKCCPKTTRILSSGGLKKGLQHIMDAAILLHQFILGFYLVHLLTKNNLLTAHTGHLLDEFINSTRGSLLISINIPLSPAKPLLPSLSW